MKNLKKVLALVMAFAMAFTMFAGAVAFEDVELGSDYSAAISMLSDLEVVSGNGKGGYEPAKAVTRAEMCVLIANMMNGGKADTARFAGGSNFSDVAHGWWGESAIAYCVQNGITYGVGGGKFAPNREITDAEAVAMLTRAMGYDTAANPLSFPYGNYTAAVNNGIVDNIPYVEGSACTKGEAAQMIYDCLFADYARLTANLNVIHNADDHDLNGATLIEDVFGLTRASDKESATDRCTQHFWVITGEDCQDEDKIYAETIEDDGDYTKVEFDFDCTADVSALIGYKVILWGEDEHGTAVGDDVDVVKAIEVVDGQVAYDYNPTMADSKDNNKLADFDDLKVEDETELNVKNGNSYVLIDWDDDGVVDYTNKTVRYYGEITSLSSKKVVVDVAGDNKNPYTLDLVDGETTKYDECEKCDDVKHDYVVELDAEEGDIVEIAVADNYESTLTITITAVEPTTKEFTKLDKKDNTYFDGEKMEQAAQNVVANSDNVLVNSLTAGMIDNDYDIWTDANGYIIHMEPTSGSTEYFMVLGVENGEDASISTRDKKAALEVMYLDGTTAELEVSFDAKSEDLYGYYGKDATLENRYTFVARGHEIVGGIYTYELDDNGDVAELDLVNGYSDEYSYVDKYDEISYKVVGDTTTTTNTVELTGADFVIVVDDQYVERTSAGVYSVDTDKVAILSVDELEDIKSGVVADDGVYSIPTNNYAEGFALVMTNVKDKNQNSSDDYVDGALFVVTDLADYLGEKTHVVGGITNISVSSSGKYTFEVDGVEYETDKDVNVDLLAPADKDADILKVFDTNKKEVMKDYGNVLFADITLLDGVVDNVYLLVEDKDTTTAGIQMGAKQWDKDETDYVVERALVETVDESWVRVYTGKDAKNDVTAADDDSIITIKEVRDAKRSTYDLTDDSVIYGIDDEPVLAAGVKLNDYIAWDDTDLEDGALEASDFNKVDLTDVLYVVDIIYDATETDTNKDGELVKAYTFLPVDDALAADTTDELTVKYENKEVVEKKDGAKQVATFSFKGNTISNTDSKYYVTIGGVQVAEIAVKGGITADTLVTDMVKALGAEVAGFEVKAGTNGNGDPMVTFTAKANAENVDISIGGAVAGKVSKAENTPVFGITMWPGNVAGKADTEAAKATTFITVETKDSKVYVGATDKVITVKHSSGSASVTLKAGVAYTEKQIAALIAEAEAEAIKDMPWVDQIEITAGADKVTVVETAATSGKMSIEVTVA